MGWRYPLPIEKFLSVMSGSTAPLALFALGQSLHYDIKRIERAERRTIITICSGKLIAFPLLAFCIGKFIFSLNDHWLSALLLMACMPSPKNMFIFSSKYGLNTKRASAVVATTTVLSFVSIYGVLYLMGGAL